MYQTLKAVSDQITKHLKIPQKLFCYVSNLTLLLVFGNVLRHDLNKIIKDAHQYSVVVKLKETKKNLSIYKP